MRILVLTLSILVAAPAAASPVIWHVPDGATRAVDDADMALDTYRDRVAIRKMKLEDERADIQHVKAAIRSARNDRRDARRAVRDARWATREAIRKDARDEQVARLTSERARARADLDTAIEHLAWHRASLEAARSDVSHARTRARQAIAHLELQQSVLLTEAEAGNGWLFRPGRFVRQKDRLDRAVAQQASDRIVARLASTDQRRDYVSNNRR